MRRRQQLPSESKYDVALSFAGEERDYVEEVAQALRDAGVRVFYDRHEEVDMWGKDLFTHLDDVYRKQAKYCVMFISASYKKKLWTNHERESAQARAFEQRQEYILPVRFDDTEIPGIRPTVHYIDARTTTPTELAVKALAKLGRSDANGVVGGDEYRRPKLTSRTFNPYDEAERFIERLHAKLRRRAATLTGDGIQFTAFDRGGRQCFRLVREGETLYSLDVWMGDLSSDKSVSFLGSLGEFRPYASGSNAVGEIVWGKSRSQPVLKLMDFSLLDGLSGGQEEYSYDEFVEHLWNRICDALEQADG
jgi:hypothetical protein